MILASDAGYSPSGFEQWRNNPERRNSATEYVGYIRGEGIGRPAGQSSFWSLSWYYTTGEIVAFRQCRDDFLVVNSVSDYRMFVDARCELAEFISVCRGRQWRITRFDGPFAFLSNFYPASVRIDRHLAPQVGGQALVAPTVEHAFAACKAVDEADTLRILNAETPGQAKRLGRTTALRPNWDEIKVGTMGRLLQQKFADGVLAAQLLATGNAHLVEDNYWHDVFWGEYEGQGRNMLGWLLMLQRGYLSGLQALTVNGGIACPA